MTTRRSFLALMGSLPLGACWAPGQEKAKVQAASADAMEESLERLAPYGPSFGGGLSNHGPMTAEALISMGRVNGVVGWVEGYAKRLEVRPPGVERIDPAKWREALGDSKRVTDWAEHFTAELSEAPWNEVVGRWVPRLAPGVAAAGLHSVIRVGHAVCSLQVKETALRLDELSQALAYWAAEYMELPGEYSAAGKFAPSRALQEVERLPAKLRASRGLITTEMSDLLGFEPFAGTIGLVETSSEDFMADLLATFAGTFANTTSSSFEFLHAVTGAAAISELLPYVAEEQRAAVMAYSWQVNAGIFARYARENLVAELQGSVGEQTIEQLGKRAIATGDEHTIKIAAACTREWRKNPDPRFLAAASKRVR